MIDDVDANADVWICIDFCIKARRAKQMRVDGCQITVIIIMMMIIWTMIMTIWTMMVIMMRIASMIYQAGHSNGIRHEDQCALISISIVTIIIISITISIIIITLKTVLGSVCPRSPVFS